MIMKNVFLVGALLASSVYGHMQMSKPYPIRSPLNPDGGDNKDYSYTSPLSSSGSDYPCKGYANDAFKSVADYTVGSEYEMDLAGSATHGGGSCQISLSYDTGKSFKVIKSMEGGCPLVSSYNFTIPSDAPSGQALLAWTWFNKIGNREMYMNCAQVTIKGSSSKREHPRDLRPKKLVARTAFSSLPPIFLANINQEGQCTTIEGDEVNFPLPGDNVQGSVSGTGYTCKSTAAFLGSGSSSSSSGSSSSSSSGSSSSTSSTSSTSRSSSSSGPSASSSYSGSSSSSATSPSTAKVLPTSTAAASSSQVATATSSASSSSSANGPAASDACSTSGQIVCSTDGNSFFMCDHNALTSMGSVAAGTRCRNGAIEAI